MATHHSPVKTQQHVWLAVLKEAFRYYAEYGNTTSKFSLDNTQFCKFCKDCPRLIRPPLALSRVDIIFAKVARRGGEYFAWIAASSKDLLFARDYCVAWQSTARQP